MLDLSGFLFPSKKNKLERLEKKELVDRGEQLVKPIYSQRDLIRKSLEGVTLEMLLAEDDAFEREGLNLYKDSTEETKKELMASASRCFSEPAFIKVLDHLIAAQMVFSMRKAQDVVVGRANINAFDLVKDVFGALDADFKQLNKEQDKFDKYEVI